VALYFLGEKSKKVNFSGPPPGFLGLRPRSAPDTRPAGMEAGGDEFLEFREAKLLRRKP
jgi:hypothetical protein